MAEVWSHRGIGLHPNPPPFTEMFTEEGTGSLFALQPQRRVPSSVATLRPGSGQASGHGGGSGWRPLLCRDGEAKSSPPAPPPHCAVALLLFLVTFTACGGGGGAPVPQGPTTLAYVVSGCQEGKDGMFLNRQALYVRRGDGEPRLVMEVGKVGPFTPIGLCPLFGGTRYGPASVNFSVFQRLGVSPDGAVVAFEVSDDFSLVSRSQMPPEQEGIYVVRADGSGLRRVGPASAAACFVPLGLPLPVFGFSPDGRAVALTDLDPLSPDPAAPQVFTLDLAAGQRQQFTHLPPVTPPAGQLAIQTPIFLAPDTIVFSSYANPRTEDYPDGANPEHVLTTFSVKTNPEDPQLEPLPVIALPGGVFIPNFSITSAEPTARSVVVPGAPPVNGPGVDGNVVLEAFIFDTHPPQVLQLTNYHRSDTNTPRLTADRQRVVFLASADPLGENSDNNCEFFSIDRTGGGLRQLTHIGAGGRNCDTFDGAGGCSSTGVRIDPLTGWVSFYSTCDPSGTNPSGGQVFTMRPDGSGLRQLTFAHGTTMDAVGTVTVELPGPWASPAREF